MHVRQLLQNCTNGVFKQGKSSSFQSGKQWHMLICTLHTAPPAGKHGGMPLCQRKARAKEQSIEASRAPCIKLSQVTLPPCQQCPVGH
eukprot:1158508-Pelagomonas_calceolata.AAC.31